MTDLDKLEELQSKLLDAFRARREAQGRLYDAEREMTLSQTELNSCTGHVNSLRREIDLVLEND